MQKSCFVRLFLKNSALTSTEEAPWDNDERLLPEALLAEHRKRLRVLEIKKAQRGIDTPPDILIEIDDIGKEINRLSTQMDRAQAVVVDLFSFAEANYHEPAQIRLDWATFFAPIPTAENWATMLLPQLENLRRTIGLIIPARSSHCDREHFQLGWPLATSSALLLASRFAGRAA